MATEGIFNNVLGIAGATDMVAITGDGTCGTGNTDSSMAIALTGDGIRGAGVAIISTWEIS